MRQPRIYSPQKLAADSRVLLDDNAFNHAVRVLRLKNGAGLKLFDGLGNEYNATLSDVERKQAYAQIHSQIHDSVESPRQLLMGQGISRGDKMDYTIQKAVELGITEITPLFSERCGVQLKGERLLKKEQHWQSIAISACEQCGRNQLPPLHSSNTLENWVATIDADLKLILDPAETQTLTTLTPPQGKIALLFGPEGGMSEQEVVLAKRHGFTGIRLGPRVLRTETAALATISAIQILWGDLGI